MVVYFTNMERHIAKTELYYLKDGYCLTLVNSSQVKVKYIFSKPFCSKRFSKDGNRAESEQFL